VYIGNLLVGSLVALVGATLLRVHWFRVVCVVYGALFLVAIAGKPWWLYATIRRTGWFAMIQNERAMRLTLCVIGILLVFLGIMVPDPASQP
jgi:hypothetical protein